MITTRNWAAVAAFCLVLPSIAWSQDDAGKTTILVSYQDADLRRVISSVAQVTGKKFIIHPNVDVQVTFASSKGLTATEYYDVLISILEANGYEAALQGETIHVVPIGVAPGTGSPPLAYGNPAILERAIRPTPYFLNGQLWGVAVFPGRNSIRFNSFGFKPGDVITVYDGAFNLSKV